MKKTILSLVAFTIVFSAFIGCKKDSALEAPTLPPVVKSLSQALTEKSEDISTICDAVTVIPGSATEEYVNTLAKELAVHTERLAKEGDKLPEQDLNKISAALDEIEQQLSDISSGETTESELLMDKYTRIANFYSSLSGKAASSAQSSSISFPSLGIELTDIASKIKNGSDSLSSEELLELSANLDEIESKLNTLNATK